MKRVITDEVRADLTARATVLYASSRTLAQVAQDITTGADGSPAFPISTSFIRRTLIDAGVELCSQNGGGCRGEIRRRSGISDAEIVELYAQIGWTGGVVAAIWATRWRSVSTAAVTQAVLAAGLGLAPQPDRGSPPRRILTQAEFDRLHAAWPVEASAQPWFTDSNSISTLRRTA